MRYGELFQNSLEQFHDKSKALDIQLLMESCLKLSRTQFWINKNEAITNITGLQTFYRHLQRLLKGEPIDYILKRKEFYGETFHINKSVLIPRPETEILVERAMGFIKSPSNLLDIGSGSGVIAVLLAKRTGSRVVAVEKSRNALRVLKINVARHNLKNRILPFYADLFPSQGGRFHMILSNPPYIPEWEWRELDRKVRDFEPKEALVAEEDGLGVIRRIAQGAGEYLVPGGHLLMEIGYNQSERVNRILKETGFSTIDFFNDYSGIPRVASAQWE
ncbi:MAG: peptide chain release factor N(5)-glutamine methyltransferase [bacterium]|nr:peptide chain release factor N(5)-glutamine methyltransferase [bacterium]